MKTIKCQKCGKVIEGYSKVHVEYLLSRHDEMHKKEEEQHGTP